MVRGENREGQPQRRMRLGIVIDRPRSVWRLGERSRRIYQEMIAAGRRQQVEVFYFFAREVNWKTGQVTGFTRGKNG